MDGEPLSVSAVNDAPTVAVAPGGTCGTDDRSGTIKLTVGDLESAAAALTLSAVSFNPTLLPAGNIAFAGGAARTVTATTGPGSRRRYRGLPAQRSAWRRGRTCWPTGWRRAGWLRLLGSQQDDGSSGRDRLQRGSIR